MNLRNGLYLALSAFTLMGSAVPVFGETTLNRTQAGTLDNNGWTLAESSEGKFSVKLPCLFNDMTTTNIATTPLNKGFALGCVDSEGVRFTAIRTTYRQEGYASSLFSKYEKGEGLPGKVMPANKLDYMGFKTLDIALMDETFLLLRVILVGEDLVMLTKEAKPFDLPPISNTSIFFDSLKLQ
jgi:hypothetical protein